MNVPLEYKVALSLFSGIGAVNARKLVAYLGSVNAVFTKSEKEMESISGLTKGVINNVISTRDEVLERAKKEVEFIQKYKIRTFFYLDREFPRRLAQCVDAPIIMYMKGNVELNAPRIISIVGTRKATENGWQITDELISGLNKKGIEVIVVSGLAYGIDVSAHKASLKYKVPTIGVVGHGLNMIYPVAHASIAKEMIANHGAMLTDFSSDCKMDPGNFIRRNRIVAGLADCTIVVESAAKGGALITAEIANSYNRDVFAFPGRPNDQYSAGCNQLIKANNAALIENADDLINYMGWEANQTPVQSQLILDLTDNEKEIIEILKTNNITTINLIARTCNQTIQQINSILLALEFKGVVKSLPGSRFKLLVRHN